MELSRNSLLYKAMSFYCIPAGDICGFTRQLIPLVITSFTVLLGTVGFVVSLCLGLYSVPLGNLNGFYFFLALFSALGLVVVICFIVFAVVLFIMDTIFEKLKNRKRAIKSSKLLGEVAKRLNPIKTKAEKLCIKIKYTD